jgi:hypothetical protein
LRFGWDRTETDIRRTQMSHNGDYLTALFGGKNSAGALANNK